MYDFATLAMRADTSDLKSAQADMYRTAEAADDMQRDVGSATKKTSKHFSRITDKVHGTPAVAKGAESAGSAFATMGRRFAIHNHSIRQASLQLGQVAQQGAVTGDYLGALAIQMPDLLLGFGTFGAVAGVVAGVLAPLATSFFEGAGGAKEMRERVDDLTDVLGDYAGLVDNATSSTDDLIERFGKGADDAREMFRVLAENKRLTIAEEASGLIEQVADPLDLSGTLKGLQPQAAAKFFGLDRSFLAIGDAAREARKEVDEVTASVIDASNSLAFAEGIEQQLASAQQLVEAFAVASDADGVRTASERQYIDVLGETILALQEKVELDRRLTESVAATTEAERNKAEAIEMASEMAETAAEKQIAAAQSVADSMPAIGKDIAAGLALGIQANSDLVTRQVSAVAEQMKRDFKEALEIRSPSRVFRGYGGDVMRGLGIGLEEGQRYISRSFASLENMFVDFLANGLNDFDDFAGQIVGGFKTMLAEMTYTAARNKIMLTMGFGPTGNATASGASGLLGGAAGIFSGGGLGSSFANLGGLLTGTVGGIDALGVAIPALGVAIAGVSVLFNAFTKKTKLLDTGLVLTVDNMGALIEQFDRVQTSRLFGLIKSTDSNTRAASADIADPITQAIEEIQGGVLSAAATLGIGATAFEDFATKVTVSTHGMTEDEASQAVTEALGQVGDEMAALALAGHDVALQGETASVTLQRLSVDLVAVNGHLDMISKTLFTAGVQGAAAASEIVQALGGSDGFAAATASYLNGFYTEAERTKMLVSQLEDEFERLGVTMPTTRIGFRSLVESIDLTSESGRALYAELLGLSSAMDEALPSAAAMSSVMTGMVQTISTDIQGQINASRTAMQESARAAELWYRAADRIDDFINGLSSSDLGGTNIFQQAAASQQQYLDNMRAALSGDVDAASAFPSSARAYLEAAMATASSSAAYRGIAAKVAADAQLLRGVSTLEGANQDVTEDLMQQQIDVLQQLAAFLSYEGLTDDQIAKLDVGIQGLVKNWDDTLGVFDGALGGIQDAMTQLSDMTYKSLQDRLDVSMDLILASDTLPKGVSQLLLAATDGVAVSIDFLLRQDLPPDLLWLAVNSESQHLKTIEILLGKNSLSAAEMKMALAASGEITRSIDLVLKSGLDPAMQRLALADVSEFARVINLTLDPGISSKIRKLALEDVHDYLVTIQTSLNAGPKLKKLILNDAGAYALTVDVALGLSKRKAALLLGDASKHVRKVEAALVTPGMSAHEKMLITKGSSDALLKTTVSLIGPKKLDGFLSAIQSGGTIQLAGGVEIDPTGAFQNWYASTTTDQITNPMTALRGSLDDLRMAMQDVADLQRLTMAQQELEATVTSRTASISAGQKIVDDIKTLLGATNVKLWDDDTNSKAFLGVGPGGRINTNFDSILQTSQSDMASFWDAWRGPDGLKAQLDAYNQQFDVSSKAIRDLRKLIKSLGGVPGFASGGMHSGGLRLVGENGPEIEATGPARIYSARDTARMMGDGSAVQGEIAALRQDLNQILNDIASSGRATARYAKDSRDAVESIAEGEVVVEVNAQ